MTPEEAIAAGAMALFGEKYGEEVRVLSMGGAHGEKYSVELCGGTHALRTGDIGLFRIVGEGAVSAGVRRIEAVAGNAAEQHVRHQIDLLNQAAAVMKVRAEDLPARLQALVDGQRKIERELGEARKALALAGSGGGRGRRNAADEMREVGGVKMIRISLTRARRWRWPVAAVRQSGRRGARGRRHQADRPRAERRAGQGPQGHGRRVQEEAGLGRGRADRRRGRQGLAVVGVTDDLAKTVSAVELVKAGVAALGGKGGGGRPDMAQGGGPDAAKASEALKAIEAAVGGAK